ncbi:baeRF12 domain-containing protein [Acetobacter fallax]|uniref:Peptidase n=1 Tax=Acetobacter fallax TaxID=1737473 RepID=A0ABX0KJ25_9PROT|nr:host attachment protein [Acetobacter fallax]NHO34380.1 peptidase [Acetobacter fallax]NHO37948.1 peptidase [Acetobacter fallax]
MVNSFDGETAYVVVDGQKAKFFKHKEGRFEEIASINSAKHEGTPGMTPSGSSLGEQKKDAFARVVADRMNEITQKSSNLDGFVIAAPGEVLHDLREHLSKPAQQKLIKTLVKDLTNIPVHDLPSHFDIPETGWKSA